MDVCSRQGVCDTHHFLIRELPSLDAATISHGLLVPLALGVAEQVHLWGDLQTQTQWSEVIAGDTMETEAGKGQQSPVGHRWNDIPHGLVKGMSRKLPLLHFRLMQRIRKRKVICSIYRITCNLVIQIRLWLWFPSQVNARKRSWRITQHNSSGILLLLKKSWIFGKSPQHSFDKMF